MKKYKIIAIIPARGGSKGLPGKNIKILLDKPLAAWSIEQALKSKYINKVIVSTDDEKIAEICKKYGAEVPFLRPKELAKDDSPTIDVLLHSIKWFEEKGEYFDVIILLEPTSPLRETEDIDQSLKILLSNSKAEAIVSVAKLESTHPEFNVVLVGDGFIKKWNGEDNFRVLRRQDLTNVYFFEGSIYASYVETLKKEKTFYYKKTLGFVVPRYKSLEIDDIYDFIMAEAILKYKLKK